MNDPTKVTAEQAEDAQKNLTKRAPTGPLVHVGCKLPSGLLLQVGQESVVLAGTNASNIIGGYGITPVSKDFWEAWLSDHKNFEPIKRGLIFVQDKESAAKSEAQERAETKGIEGVNADNPAAGVKKADKEG